MLGRSRERIRAWTDPVGRGLFRLRLRPNHLTVIGLGVSFLAASAFSAGRTRAAGLLLIVAGLCDFFDGALARVSGQVTPFGAFLDRSEEHTSELQSLAYLVCRLLLEKKKHICIAPTARPDNSSRTSVARGRSVFRKSNIPLIAFTTPCLCATHTRPPGCKPLPRSPVSPDCQ